MSRSRMNASIGIGATAVLGLALLASAASADRAAPAGTMDRYLPVQSLAYDLGSKSTSGYFVQQDGHCQVVLMIAEASDPDADAALPSAARLRVTLEPGQSAGLDSEEGRSINLTCGQSAESLSVTQGTTAQMAQAF